MTYAVMLIFVICAAVETEHADDCEHGEIRWHACDAAEAWLRAGLRAGQVLHILDCQRPAA